MIDIHFNSIEIHHFLSFEHAEIDLRDKGYCLVSGINKNPKDSAKSNGSGKSTVFNALSYALTGETLQGLKSNLPNIAYNDGCWVKLDFCCNGKSYSIIRSRDDKKLGTDLRITIDGKDESGKGIRESQAILDKLLPDVTSELIGSAILIGQGMPMRFTSNTPAGRKEVLEHLSQSDFMIQDIKDRIAKRQSELSKKVREVEDSLLKDNSQRDVFARQIEASKKEYEEKYSTEPDFDAQLKELRERQGTLQKSIDSHVEESNGFGKAIDGENSKLISITSERSNVSDRFRKEHQEAVDQFNEERSKLSGRKYFLEQEISKMKAVRDVCPTCGQKIPGAVKPDTSKQEAELEAVNAQLKSLAEDVAEDNRGYNEVLGKIANKYDSKIAELQESLSTAKRNKSSVDSLVESDRRSLRDVESSIMRVENEQRFHQANKERLLSSIREAEANMAKLEESIKATTSEKEDLDQHVDTINKFSTIIKRDFRGFLLKSIIEYIDSRAKEYASKIFGCNELSFQLDGNNIGISFCNKDYENLSGGEKQRLDLIVQFAIRDFMCNYLQFSCNILALDEITDALDSDSCYKVINFITEELKDIESVFIISHHSDELAIPCDSELKIEKDEMGISHVVH